MFFKYIYIKQKNEIHNGSLIIEIFWLTYNSLDYCEKVYKSTKRFLLLDFHCEYHFSVYFRQTEYDSG